MELSKRLVELDSELRCFECRPKTLVPDIVLLGLATDVFESALAVQDTACSPLPHKAYSNAQLAFEGAQNLLVLATHEEYEAAGARAWVYFELKDAGWRVAFGRQKDVLAPGLTENHWLDQRVADMAGVWNSVSQGQGQLLLDALAVVRRERRKRPDNWLHEDMTLRQHCAYTLFAASGSKKFLVNTAELNKAMYQTLCRETHARPRLDSFGVIHDRDRGTVSVVISPRNLEKARYAVKAGTELSIQEAVAALRWQRMGAV